jgi:hypothetical protein
MTLTPPFLNGVAST